MYEEHNWTLSSCFFSIALLLLLFAVRSMMVVMVLVAYHYFNILMQNQKPNEGAKQQKKQQNSTFKHSYHHARLLLNMQMCRYFFLLYFFPRSVRIANDKKSQTKIVVILNGNKRKKERTKLTHSNFKHTKICVEKQQISKVGRCILVVAFQFFISRWRITWCVYVFVYFISSIVKVATKTFSSQ